MSFLAFAVLEGLRDVTPTVLKESTGLEGKNSLEAFPNSQFPISYKFSKSSCLIS